MPTRNVHPAARRRRAPLAPPAVAVDAAGSAAEARLGAKAPKSAKTAKTAKGSKPAKPRPQLVRDSFTMPASDFGLIELMKVRALGARRAAKKSELLRAGLRALAALDAKSLVDALNQLEPVKTGRPKKA